MHHLQELAEQTGTDKAWHGYGEIYGPLTQRFRDFPVRFMEHGLLGGHSAEMWSRWFTHPDARLHFVDIHDRGYRPKDPRIILHFGSAADPDFMCGVYETSGALDMCADDASHICSQQINQFDIGWKHIKPGGIWSVEDTHTVHSMQHCDMPHNGTIIDYFARIASDMQDGRGADGCAAPNPSDRWHSIERIEVRKGLIIVQKRA